MTKMEKFFKRVLDIIGAFIGLIVFSPICVFVAFAIKIDSPGPILVKLERISGGKKIRIYKFRSMINDAYLIKAKLTHLNERINGPFFKIRKDPRVTKVGRIIRKFHIDETPQLINVFKGELTLVGPRPHEPEEVSQYPQEYQILTLSKAGMTGLSQVNGASSLPFLKELEIDKYYLENWSVWFDLKIIIKTLLILLSAPKGI